MHPSQVGKATQIIANGLGILQSSIESGKWINRHGQSFHSGAEGPFSCNFSRQECHAAQIAIMYLGLSTSDKPHSTRRIELSKQQLGDLDTELRAEKNRYFDEERIPTHAFTHLSGTRSKSSLLTGPIGV